VNEVLEGAVMAEITVRAEAGRAVFAVTFVVESGPRPSGHVPEAARLRLAFQNTPGSTCGTSRKVGEYFSGQLEDAIDYYECPVEPSPANAAALLATGFPCSAEAAELAARQGVDPALVDRIRADVEAVHQECIRKFRWANERLHAGDNSEEVRQAWREAMEGLAD